MVRRMGEAPLLVIWNSGPTKGNQDYWCIAIKPKGASSERIGSRQPLSLICFWYRPALEAI